MKIFVSIINLCDRSLLLPLPQKITGKLIFLIIFSILHIHGSAQNVTSSETILLRTPNHDTSYVLESIKQSREIHKKQHNEKEEYTQGQNAINVALELKDTLLYARALDNMGLLHRYHQQYLQALAYHIKAGELVKNIPVPSIYKMIFANNAGVAARYSEKYDISVSSYLEALKIAEKESNLKNIAIASNGLGNALSNLPNRRQEALDYFNRALKTEELQKNDRGIAMNLLSISHFYIDQKQFEVAREYLTRLMTLNKALNDIHGIAITEEYFGISYLREEKNFSKAHDHLQQALKSYEKQKDKMKQAELLSLLGEVQKMQKKKAEALAFYKRSHILTDSIANKGLMVANALNMAEIYESENRPAEALKNYRIAQRFRDSINLHNQEIKIAALTKNHELEKKESQIKQLELEKKRRNEHILLQEEKIKQQQTILLLIAFSVISIFSIVALQYRNVKAKKKTAELLEIREKEKLQAIYDRNLAQAEMLASRMKINPHFLFNSLNAINHLIQQGENGKASKYLIVFSRFVRMVLETSKNTVIPLNEELEIIRHYLALEENRFDNNFSYQIIQDEMIDCENVFIPPLLLQPFVENAIWHGLMPVKKEKKELTIRILQKDQNMEIIIEDNGAGRSKNKKYKPANDIAHKSMGTEITRDRIDLFNKSFNSNISCITEDKKDTHGMPSGTLVRLTFTNTNELVSASPF